MSSATNTILPSSDGEKREGTPSARPNPVALEVPVSLTGARPNSDGSRDLFTEENVTVLVFRDGAVIRLTATVSAGQLLFLTNKKSGQEVVCQVVHKRPVMPNVCYVELQFTEEKADFWGVAFPDEKKAGAELKATEQAGAEQTRAKDAGAPVVPQSPEDVDRLKKELEALRQQVQELEKKNAGKAPAKTVAEEVLKTASTGPAKPGGETEGSKPQTEAPLMPAATEKKETARPVVGMALPMRKSASSGAGEGTKDPSEELLPKPELDFSKLPDAVQAGGAVLGPLHSARRVDIKKVLVPLLVVLVVVLAWSVWNGKMWTYLPFGKKTTAAVGPARPAKPGAGGQAAGAMGSAGVAGSAMAKGGAATASGGAMVSREKNANAAPVAENGGDGSVNGNAEETKAENTESEGARQPVAAKEKPGKKKGASGVGSAAGGNAAEISADDGAVQPAKLLKAANPVYPPDAMRSFITGDVKVEAVVEADGHVSEVKVISGPRALREAAAEALKKYQFAPATQGGKAVASKVTETVKFWFNP